jgi:hypothetical protein
MLGNGPPAWAEQRADWGFSDWHKPALRGSASGSHSGSNTEANSRAAAASTCLSGLCTEAAVLAGDVGRQGLAHKLTWMLLTYSQTVGMSDPT